MSKVQIAVIMGSDSDLPIIKDACDLLNKFEIKYDLLILSAHRTPEEISNYAKYAFNNGIKVIIAGAGGAAHLAGVIASYFPLPVIGIPIKSASLNGIDSLYSVVQMPPGVPVATVAINGAKNATILALQILAVSDLKIKKSLVDYKRQINEEVISKNKKLNKIGIENYLSKITK